MEEYKPPTKEVNSELETAISQGLQTTLEYLQAGIGRQPLRPRLSELNNPSLPPSPESSKENPYIKVEANALAGYFMVPIWHNAKAWLDDNPGKLKRYTKHGKTKIEDVAEIRKCLSNQPSDLLLSLYSYSLQTLETQVDEYADDIKSTHGKLITTGVPYEDWPAEVRNGVRYAKILPQSDLRKELFEGSPRVHLKSGFKAAQIVSWAVLGSIPTEYEKKNGRPINPNELEIYIAKGKAFVLYLASQHIEIFRILIREILTPTTSEDEGVLPFLRNVAFQPEGKFPFEVDRDTLQRIVDKCKELPVEEARTGCPAIVARDGQQNLVSVLYDWNTSLARNYYFSSLKSRPSFIKPQGGQNLRARI